MLVAGIDGARGGWIVAYAELRDPLAPRLLDIEFVRRIDATLLERCAVIAIDIPIGLAQSQPRRCDLEARALLSPHGSRVFPAPVRATLAHVDDYAAAGAASRAASGKGLSKQAWHLLPKIADVDALFESSPLADRLVECHPEVAFTLMAGAVVAERKKTTDGAARRRALLIEHLALPTDWQPPRLTGAADDVLDAVACAWSAARIASGTAARFGGAGDHVERDPLGRPMRIWA